MFSALPLSVACCHSMGIRSVAGTSSWRRRCLLELERILTRLALCEPFLSDILYWYLLESAVRDVFGTAAGGRLTDEWEV